MDEQTSDTDTPMVRKLAERVVHDAATEGIHRNVLSLDAIRAGKDAPDFWEKELVQFEKFPHESREYEYKSLHKVTKLAGGPVLVFQTMRDLASKFVCACINSDIHGEIFFGVSDGQDVDELKKAWGEGFTGDKLTQGSLIGVIMPQNDNIAELNELVRHAVLDQMCKDCFGKRAGDVSKRLYGEVKELTVIQEPLPDETELTDIEELPDADPLDDILDEAADDLQRELNEATTTIIERRYIVRIGVYAGYRDLVKFLCQMTPYGTARPKPTWVFRDLLLRAFDDVYANQVAGGGDGKEPPALELKTEVDKPFLIKTADHLKKKLLDAPESINTKNLDRTALQMAFSELCEHLKTFYNDTPHIPHALLAGGGGGKKKGKKKKKKGGGGVQGWGAMKYGGWGGDSSAGGGGGAEATISQAKAALNAWKAFAAEESKKTKKLADLLKYSPLLVDVPPVYDVEFVAESVGFVAQQWPIRWSRALKQLLEIQIIPVLGLKKRDINQVYHDIVVALANYVRSSPPRSHLSLKYSGKQATWTYGKTRYHEPNNTAVPVYYERRHSGNQRANIRRGHSEEWRHQTAGKLPNFVAQVMGDDTIQHRQDVLRTRRRPHENITASLANVVETLREDHKEMYKKIYKEGDKREKQYTELTGDIKHDLDTIREDHNNMEKNLTALLNKLLQKADDDMVHDRRHQLQEQEVAAAAAAAAERALADEAETRRKVEQAVEQAKERALAAETAKHTVEEAVQEAMTKLAVAKEKAEAKKAKQRMDIDFERLSDGEGDEAGVGAAADEEGGGGGSERMGDLLRDGYVVKWGSAF